MLSASDAKSLAQDMLARAWARRNKLILRLPPSRISITPGCKLDLPLTPARWTVDKSTIEGFAVVTELHPSGAAAATVAGDGGRIVPNPDLIDGPVTLGLLDIPNVLGPSSNEPVLIVAASTAATGWKRRAVQISFGGQTLTIDTARSKSALGHALTLLGSGSAELIDEENSVDVQLLDPEQWLTSCDDEALAAGLNLAVLGGELLQFGSALAQGGGKFRLSRLLRGRGGTEWACAGHAVGDLFCLIQSQALQAVSLPSWSVGAAVTATVSGGTGASINFAAEGLRPPPPINLVAEHEADGSLALGWTRRSRQGFAWVDGIDAPLGEAREQYTVTVSGATGSIELQSDQSTLVVPASMLADVGAGTATVEVRQVGDVAASRPTQTSLIIS